MNLSKVFIYRRVGTVLLAIAVVLVGLVAYHALPISAMPQVEYPTIAVNASLPGASADTMATAVATPLERMLTNIPGVTEMTSSSTLGQTTITLQFDLSRTIDSAAIDVQTQITAAGGLLPKTLPNPPTFHKVNPAGSSIYSLALTSDTMPLIDVDRYAETYIAQPISQVSGVGIVDYHGQLRPAVRVQIDPDKLASLGLTLEDVRTVLGTVTVLQPKGTLNGPHQAITLDATDQLLKAASFHQTVLTYRNGAPIFLSDVATIIDAPEDIRQAAWFQGKRAVIVDVAQYPGSNIMTTIDGIKAKLPELAASLPPSIKLHVVADRTQTIKASVDDVQVTLMITIGLVVMVILVFLRNFWATLIPSLTIPLSLIATFAVMYVLGFSIDNLSLMGLTIAVGFVVDDAIVVIENIMLHIEEGKSPMEAALLGSREVGFTIVSMTLSLIAVFIPLFAMGGLIGRIFREFAITITVALIASAIVSLTVTPMLCGWLIGEQKEQRHSRVYQWLERGFTRVNDGYARLLDLAFRHQRVMLLGFLATIGLTVLLYVQLPKGFFPQVDSSFVLGTIRGAPDSSFDTMSERVKAAAKIAMADPAVQTVDYWAGANPNLSEGRVLLNLKPLSDRDTPAPEVMARVGAKMAHLVGITQGMQVRQDIQIGGRISIAQYQYTLQGGDTAALGRAATTMKDRLSALPQLRDVTSDKQAAATSLKLVIDRVTAGRLGIRAQDIDNTLYDAFGQRQVATLFDPLSQYYLIEEVNPRFQLDAEALRHLYVRSATTQGLVPLSLLVRLERGVSPVTVAHQGLFPAVTLSFNLAPGVALGDAVKAIKAAEQAANLPNGVTGTFQGAAQAFQSSLKSQPFLILAAIIAIYVVLGVLYESAIHPLTIISTLPSAGVGALLALMICGKDLSIMGIIGILLLIGIVKKNAIMMIDYALHARRERHLNSRAAIREASLRRFRPIMMTTLAALFGAIPLAIGSGAGAELRQPLGIAIVGGLIVSQMLTLFTTPVVFLWFERVGIAASRFRRRRRRRSRGNKRPAQGEPAIA